MSPIAHLRGILEDRGADWLIIDVGGVGFKVNTSTSTILAFGSPGERVELRTYLQVRENDVALYGFATSEELHLFEMLMSVSGVGPRAALALLSAMRSDDLAATIAQGNVQRLTSVPGVGRRTAERLVLELKDKLREYALMTRAANTDRDEVVAALMALGYTGLEAQEAAGKTELPPDAPIEEQVRLALGYFSRR